MRRGDARIASLSNPLALSPLMRTLSQSLVFTTFFLASIALAETDLGAQIPENARKVAEHRYRAPGDYEATMKFYKNVYSPTNFPRRAIVNQPGIKAVHIANPSGKGGWEGLNIYVTNDEVRISVVPADKSGTTPSTK